MENKKTKEKIAAMKKAGKIMGDTMQIVLDAIKPGMTELEVDKLAEKTIIEKGGLPAFKKVPGYKHTICAATNDVVVHGIPGKRILKEGDIICVDCGVFVDGYFTDMAETIVVGGNDTTTSEVLKFLKVGQKALKNAISQAKPGNRIGHISMEMQKEVEGNDFSIVKSLIGHGVGKELHEWPEIPGYLDGKLEKTPLIVPGMTLALEVIYNMGSDEVVYENDDGWTIVTEDGSLSAVFERTILITEKGNQIITPLPGEK
jgi:methionyl aminopeptidase